MAPLRRNPVAQAVAETKAFLLDSKLNILLVAFPFAIISKAAGWGDGATFTLSMLALCPLAERLGFVTEQLAMYTNDTLGGLLNASFGNCTEIVLSGFALKHGYLRIVQLSLLGSVISNLLLVMGTAFVAGGIKNKVQKFNQTGVNVNSALLFLGVLAVLLPSLLHETQTEVTTTRSELILSRFESLFLLFIYACFLLFQLYTHRHLYEELEEDDKKSDGRRGGSDPGEDAEIGRASNNPLLSSTSKGFPGSGLTNGGSGGGIGTPGNGNGGGNALLQRSGSNRHSATNNPGLYLELTVPPHVRTVDVVNPQSRTSSGRPAEAGTPAVSERQNGVHGGPARGVDYLDGHLLDGATPSHGARTRAGSPGPGSEAGEGRAEPEDDDGEELVLSKVGCFLWLTGVTVLIALLSEWIMDAITGASRSLGVPMPFLVTIVLPIVGNAAEHASAIVFAYKNRMEVALGVAVGSSTQVAVLVVPFCVVLGWIMGQPMDLDFNAFEACVYTFCVLLAIITIQDGTGNWLKGALLLVTYIMVSAGFWLHKDTFLDAEQEGV